MHPTALGIKGSTQPEIFKGTVDAMTQQLKANPTTFWQDTLATDGPMEIWILGGDRYLFNGNHRFQAALQADVEIPTDAIRIVNKVGLPIPTFLLKDLTWLPGLK